MERIAVVFHASGSLCSLCLCVCMCYLSLFVTFRKYCRAYLPHSQSFSDCEKLSVRLCSGKVEFWVWPADILGKNVICKEKMHTVYLCVCVSFSCWSQAV